jgi:hypothetical protein
MDHRFIPIAPEVRQLLQVAQKIIPPLGLFMEKPSPPMSVNFAAYQVGGQLISLVERYPLDFGQRKRFAKVTGDAFKG